MSTFKNAYRLVEDVRRGINEYSTAYMQATDTSCTHLNALIVDEINRAQQFVYALLIMRIPGEFLTSVSLTGVASVFTLPADFGKLCVFKDDDNRKVWPIDIDRLKISGSGNKRLYYRKGNTLVLDRDSITDTYTLWYYKRPRDVTMGKASAEDKLEIVTSKDIDDYYNGMYIENVSDSEADLITDYTGSTREITHDETLDSADYYGIVPDMPEMFLDLIAPRAIMQMKLLPTTMMEVTKFDTENYMDMVISTLRAFAGSSEDVSVEELFLALEPSMPTQLGIVQTS